MLLIDVIIRYPAITLLCLFAVLALRDGRSYKPAIYGALLCLTTALLLIHSAPEVLLPPEPFYKLIKFMSIADIALVWWFGRSLFEDDFQLGPLEWAGFVLLSAPVLLFRVNQFYPMENFPQIQLDIYKTVSSILAMGHLVYIALRGRSDDLIEGRRKFRFYFVLALAAVVAVTVVGEELFYDGQKEGYNTFRAALCLPMAGWAVWWLTRLHPEILAFQPIRAPQVTAPAIDPRDGPLRAALIEQMEVHHIYTEPGLTIRSLAQTLNAPEHHLRGLINQGLGYRNFSSFVNYYRIGAVTDAMERPENARIPVLTMAMDAGYNSLAPFNRAFKSVHGQTPSDYRRAFEATLVQT